MFYSPLRYPGGKNKLSGFISKVCIDNNIHGHYVEPYAGGASVALFLLMEKIIDRITINDKDSSIYAFWYSVINYTDELCDLISNCDISIENRIQQKAVQQDPDAFSIVQLGFSTLFLNRTNRDGIIKAGVIGGNAQNGNYKLDCRFNKSEIITKIRRIATFRQYIAVTSMDALELIDFIEETSDNKNTIFYFDPPYYLKGSMLYMNYYQKSDHSAVAERIKEIEHINWIVSYDNHEVIKKLYKPFIPKEYTFNHSANTSKVGKEILYFSEGMILPQGKDWNPINFKLSRKPNTKKILYRA